MIPLQYRALAVDLGLLLAMALAGAVGWFTNGWRTAPRSPSCSARTRKPCAASRSWR